MARADTVPCALCGYHAPGADCPHCGLTASAPSLAAAPLGSSAGRLAQGVLDGLRAVPQGMLLLATTRGTKRWLLPPFLLTVGLFVGLFLWTLDVAMDLLGALAVEDLDAVDFRWEWMHSAAQWLVNVGILQVGATLSSWVLSFVIATLTAMWTFSVAYEAFAGPFLDEIQGRLEARWFGHDPRNRIARPVRLAPERCARWTIAASAVGGLCVVLFFFVAGPAGWLALLGVPLAFLLAARLEPEYGPWLVWVARLEGRTLWVSLKAAGVAAVFLVLLLPLKFVPAVGILLFAGAAGFVTSITLLDIPFERRGWSVSKRLQFLLHNLPAATAYGFVASLVFLVPILGPLLMVPSASIGGLWLLCRIDKDSLRPAATRMRRAEAPPAALAPPTRAP